MYNSVEDGWFTREESPVFLDPRLVQGEGHRDPPNTSGGVGGVVAHHVSLHRVVSYRGAYALDFEHLVIPQFCLNEVGCCVQ